MILNFRQFVESAWGGREYKVPQDKEQQLYDFYMLSFLSNRIPEKGERDDNVSQIEYALYEAKATLLPKLKKSMLNAMYFSIASELRHVTERNSIEYIAEDLEGEISQKHADVFTKYIEANARWSRVVNQDSNPSRRTRYTKDNSVAFSYYYSYQAALEAGDKKTFVEMAQYLFKNMEWNTHFGGESWASICDGWLNLNRAKDLNNMQVWIDHAYDLQHNTGSVFNKIVNYAKGGNFTWLSDALEHKKNIKELHEIINKVSPKLKTLATRALKLTGKSLVDFERDFIPDIKQIMSIPEMNVNKFILQTSFGNINQQMARMLINYHYAENDSTLEISKVLTSLKKWIEEKVPRPISRKINEEEIMHIYKNDLDYIDGSGKTFLSVPLGPFASVEGLNTHGYYTHLSQKIFAKHKKLNPTNKEKKDELYFRNNAKEFLSKLNDTSQPYSFGDTAARLIRAFARWEQEEGNEISIVKMPDPIIRVIMDQTGFSGNEVLTCAKEALNEIKSLNQLKNKYADFNEVEFIKNIILEPNKYQIPYLHYVDSKEVREKVFDIFSDKSINLSTDYHIETDFNFALQAIKKSTGYINLLIIKSMVLNAVHYLILHQSGWRSHLANKYNIQITEA